MSETAATDLAQLDATAQAELIRNGEVSAVELVEAGIERVERLNGELNAVIRDQFDEARERAAGELPDGPLRGVPFLLKDLGPTVAGKPHHMGTKVLKEANFIAPFSSWLTERIEAAGLVILGYTNTPELGLVAQTEPEAYGPSRNPWNTDYSTLGSSGGSAAAVASGMVPMAHANDGGGSIRLPAAAQGLVGLKPSRGRVTMGPILGDALGGMTNDLCVSWSVRDTATFLDAVQGPGLGDPYWAPPPERPYIEEVGTDPGKLRIGLFTDIGSGIGVDPELARLTEESGRELEELGHSVEHCEPLDLGGREMIETFTLVWAAGVTWNIDQIAMLTGREIGPDDVEPLTWALYEGGREHTAGDLLTARSQHQAYGRMIALYMAGHGYDLLVTPSFAALPPRIGELDQRAAEDPMEIFRANEPLGAFTALFNATGQPAVSLPMRMSDSGLPVGTQFVAQMGGEDLLLRVAAQIEQAYPWSDRKPPVHA